MTTPRRPDQHVQPRRRTSWHTATITEVRAETPHSVRLTLAVPTWPGGAPGSHVDVRLTAPDGYQASRSYSVASSTPWGHIVLAVDELPDGEVSPYLVRDARPGDTMEVHGPLGSYFVWQPGVHDRPVQLVAGGSGVVPLYAMAVAHDLSEDPTPFRLLYSVRTPADAFFTTELDALAGPSFTVDHVYTRHAPDDWPGTVGRLTRASLAARTIPPADRPRIYVCGSTGFAETVTGWLVDLGHASTDILTERFGGL